LHRPLCDFQSANWHSRAQYHTYLHLAHR
jgi:hypothetical protein